MDGKIHKSQKDLKSLLQTLANLKGRNNNLKGNLILQKTGDVDKAKVQELELSVMAANKEKFDIMKEFDRENADYIQNDLLLKEKEDEVIFLTQIKILKKNIQEISSKIEITKKENNDKKEKYNRSEMKYKNVSKGVKVTQNSDLDYTLKLEVEMQKNKFLKNAIAMLCSEIPEMQSALHNDLQEIGIEINNRSISDKGNFF